MQILKKTSEARRAKFDELRRTLQYVEASRASATKLMGFFSRLLYFELSRHIRREDLIDRELSREQSLLIHVPN